MNLRCIIFGASNLTPKEIKGKKVIEVGSCDVNGSLRPIIESWEPAEYIGIDIVEGSGVDIICDAENVVEKFGQESFDIVISTELLEHTRNWRKVISSIKNICKSDGIILITTCAYGFIYHAYPNDFWRYEVEDMNNIFSDCEILALEKDMTRSGVFVKIRKPKEFIEKDLSAYALYSIVANRRVEKITDKDFCTFYYFHLLFKRKLKDFLLRISRFMFNILLSVNSI